MSVLGGVSGLVTLDMDGDGDLDLATASLATLAISIVENEGGRQFSQPVPILLTSPTLWIIAADMDGDGSRDLITGHEGNLTNQPTLTFLRGDGRGGFPGGHVVPLSSRAHAANAADVDSDGDTDIVLVLGGPRSFMEARLVILLNLGEGRLHERRIREGKPVQLSLALADLDVDGDVDIAPPLSVHPGSGSNDGRPMAVFLNDGGGSFGPPHEVPLGRAHVAMVAADLDGDGLPDITISEGRLSTFFPRVAAASPDRDSDGVPDECGTSPFRRGDADADGAVGLSDPLVVLLHLFRGGAAPPCLRAADADDDGRVGLDDAVRVLRFLFLGGTAPAFPAGACGLDPTPDDLACDAHAPGA